MRPPASPEPGEFLVVGAGSAGCVLARRLADAGRRVHLLESGPAVPTPEGRVAIANGHQPAVLPGLNWRFDTTVRGRPGAAGGARWLYEAGRVLGGSSAVNATQALRLAPQDHDAWAREAGPQWAWPQVLPALRALEDDPLGPSPLHGRGGPLPIRRATPAELVPLQAGLLQAARDHGFGLLDDLNDPAGAGVGMIPRNVVDGRRISAADAYLGPTRDLPGLRISAGVHVHHLLWDTAGRCRGVRADQDGRVIDVLADAVVLCAGVVGTPALLLRSGVGAPEALGKLGIPVQLALPGVGRNLVEHPVVGLWGIVREGAGSPGEPVRQTLLRCRSDSGTSGIDDLHLCIMGGRDPALLAPGRAYPGRAAAGLTVCYNTPASRGELRLDTVDPHAAPRIALNCLGDDADLAPLREGVRLAWDLLQRPALRGLFDEVFAWNEALLRSPRALDQALRSFVRPAAHLCGTARMGRSPEAGAVVDGHGRLHGCSNVWVADASAIPIVPSAPPHLAVLMQAECVAHGLLEAARLHAPPPGSPASTAQG